MADFGDHCLFSDLVGLPKGRGKEQNIDGPCVGVDPAVGFAVGVSGRHSRKPYLDAALLVGYIGFDRLGVFD